MRTAKILLNPEFDLDDRKNEVLRSLAYRFEGLFEELKIRLFDALFTKRFGLCMRKLQVLYNLSKISNN